ASRIMGLAKTGSFDIGKPLSFIEISTHHSFTDADDAILRGLLEMSDEELARYRHGPHADAVTRLQSTGLDAGEPFDLLEQDIRQTAERLEDKVSSVALAGREVWRRTQSKSL